MELPWHGLPRCTPSPSPFRASGLRMLSTQLPCSRFYRLKVILGENGRNEPPTAECDRKLRDRLRVGRRSNCRAASHLAPHLVIKCLSNTKHMALHPFIACEQCLIPRTEGRGEWGREEGIIIHQGLESDEIYTLPRP